MTLKPILVCNKILFTLGLCLIICAFAATNAYAAGCNPNNPDCGEGTWVNIFPSGGDYNDPQADPGM